MTLTWEEAQDKWARHQVLTIKKPQADFEITGVEFGNCGPYEMSEYTWGYDSPNVVISYKASRKTYSLTVDVSFETLIAQLLEIGNS